MQLKYVHVFSFVILQNKIQPLQKKQKKHLRTWTSQKGQKG